MLKRSLIVGASALAMGTAAPAFAFQGPTELPDLPVYEESGSIVTSTGIVFQTLTIDIQNVRNNLIDNAFTNSGPDGNGSVGAVNAQQNNGNNNVMNSGTGIVTGVGTDDPATGAHQNAVATGAGVGGPGPFSGGLPTFYAIPSFGVGGGGEGGEGGQSLEAVDPTTVPNITAYNNAFVFGLYPGLVHIDQDTGDETPVVVDENGDTRFLEDTTVGGVDFSAGDLVPLGEIEFVDFAEGTPDRSNLLTGSVGADPDTFTESAFAGFEGVVNVQQNNGDANAMSQSQAVFANQGRQVGPQSQGGGVNNQVWDAGRIVGDFENPFAVEHEPEGTLLETADYFEEIGIDGFDVASNSIDPFYPDNALLDLNTYMDNTINNGAFDGINGSFQVQQNNGNVNSMGQSTQVLANNLSAADTLPADLTGNGIAGGSTSSNITSSGVVASSSVFDGDFNLFRYAAALPGLILPEEDQNGEPIVFENPLESAIESEYNLDPVEYSLPTLSNRKDNLIENSFNGNATGLVSVQQNNGHANAMGQATQVAVRLGVEDESQLLGSANVYGAVLYNMVFEFGVIRDNTINNAFNDFAGAANVQQNNGHGNSMNQVIGVNGGIAEGSPVFGEKGGTNNAELAGVVSNNLVIALSDDAYENTITGSFNGLGDGFYGVANVQQNNGSSNVMNSAVSVTVTGLSTVINTTPTP